MVDPDLQIREGGGVGGAGVQPRPQGFSLKKMGKSPGDEVGGGGHPDPKIR